MFVEYTATYVFCESRQSALLSIDGDVVLTQSEAL